MQFVILLQNCVHLFGRQHLLFMRLTVTCYKSVATPPVDAEFLYEFVFRLFGAQTGEKRGSLGLCLRSIVQSNPLPSTVPILKVALIDAE